LAKKIVSRLEFEISQIDQLLQTYAELLDRAQRTTPDLVEVTATASVLHSFYNGLESIFTVIAKEIDHDTPVGQQWHRDLLTQMTRPTPTRQAVLSLTTAHRLADYLGFRHFYRHSYSFFLDWGELERLVGSLAEVWAQTKQELTLFLDSFSR
jgi:hypothetical protein